MTCQPPANETLMPCPFCGARALHHGDAIGVSHLVRCGNPMCGSQTCDYITRASATAAWNRRATPPAAPAEDADKTIGGKSKYGVPYEVRTAGQYGPQLYLFRKDGVFRYPMEEITESLDRHMTTHPSPAEYAADRTALTEEARKRHAITTPKE